MSGTPYPMEMRPLSKQSSTRLLEGKSSRESKDPDVLLDTTLHLERIDAQNLRSAALELSACQKTQKPGDISTTNRGKEGCENFPLV